MYSPSTKLWTELEYRPTGSYGAVKSHVVLDDNIYFATEPLDDGDYVENIFSYSLSHGSWKVLSTSHVNASFFVLHLAFESPVFPIGDLLFGEFSFYDTSLYSMNYTVAASPY